MNAGSDHRSKVSALEQDDCFNRGMMFLQFMAPQPGVYSAAVPRSIRIASK